MIELLIMSSIGILLILIGFLIWKKRMYMLISSLLYSRVSDEDMEKYAALISKALILLGTGIILAGSIDFFSYKFYAITILIISIVTAVVLVLIAIFKYNKGFF